VVLVGAMAALSLVPFVLLMMTCFVKISVKSSPHSGWGFLPHLD